MTLEEFDNLPKDVREIIFGDAWDLYDLVNKHPINNNDVRILVEWSDRIGTNGGMLAQYLDLLRLPE